MRRGRFKLIDLEAEEIEKGEKMTAETHLCQSQAFSLHIRRTKDWRCDSSV